MKDLSPGSNKFGVNGMNMLMALQPPPVIMRPPSTTAIVLPLQARAPTVESPIINTQSAAMSLASLQPPLLTAPPLQPRPATTGSLDLMLPLQPKLLPGYCLQSSYLSSTLSTVRPPDLRKDDFLKVVEVIPEFTEECSVDVSSSIQDCDKDDGVCINSVSSANVNDENENANDDTDNSSLYVKSEINSNTIDAKTVDSSVVDSNDNSPNNNSH